MSGDRDLRDAFARLREAESKTIPPFRVEIRDSRLEIRRTAFALIVLILIISGSFFIRKDRHPASPPDVTLSTWRAPTDFLLDTPGRELLTSSPRLQPQTPVINISGGRS